jgi:hypothetical protein
MIRASCFWSRFERQHLVEVRALQRGLPAQRRWILAEEVESIVPQLQRLNSQGFEIYAGVNPRAAFGASDGDAVAEIVAFHADIDDGLCPHWPASVPRPTLLVDSGHGFHVYWCLSKPVAVNDANRERLKAINRSLAIAVGGDAVCCDLARILRVPGFINHKPPVAEARILQFKGERRYRLADFRSFKAPSIEGKPSRAGVQVSSIRPARLTSRVQSRFEEVRRLDSVLRYAWRGEYGDGSSDSRYVAVRQLLASGRFTPAEIVALVVNRRWYNRRSREVRSVEHVFSDALRLVAKLRRSRPSSLVHRRITGFVSE